MYTTQNSVYIVSVKYKTEGRPVLETVIREKIC